MYLDREFHNLFKTNSSPRVPTKIRTIIHNLNSQIHRANQKLSRYNGYYTSGFSMLVNVIYRGMSDELEKYNNDFDRLYNVLEFQRQYLTRAFDSSGGGGLPHHKYFVANGSCKEFVFSVRPRNPAHDYPLDKGVDEWKKYRPFRLIDHDSSDFTLNITSGLLNFNKHHPRFALFTFDPVAAVLQFCALRDEGLDIYQYVHQYLIMPAQTLDNIRLWLISNYSEWFVSRSRDYTEIPMVTSSYVHMPLMLKQGMDEIGSIIDSAGTGHVGVSRLLSSLPLPHNTTVPHYATVLYERSSVDDIGEYDWGTFMIYRRMLEVLIRAMATTINSTETKTHIYLLKRTVQLMLNGGIFSGIKDSYTKHFVKSSVYTLHRQVLELYDRARG